MIARVCLILALLFAGGLCSAFPAFAHEVRPAYLDVTETAPGTHQVTWKQPVLGDRRLRIRPVFPAACGGYPDAQETGEGGAASGLTVARVGGAVVERWRITCDLSTGTIGVDGLNRTLTDAFVRVTDLSGDTSSALLRPGTDRMALGGPGGAAIAAYVRLGIEHIIFGYDHLLFVLGMCLLVARRQLIWTLTAFTLAHSITLGCAALLGAALPGPPAEIVIALSIAMLGAEAVYRQRGRVTLAQRFPAAIAFGFGLIHGFGFAGALGDLGLPKGAEAAALLLFNIGVEVGQILFVCVVLALAWAVGRIRRAWLAPLITASAYAIGTIGMFWTLERIFGVINAA